MVTPLERIFYLILMLGALAIATRIYCIRMATIRRGRKLSGESPPPRGCWRRVLVYVVGQWSGLQNVCLKDLAGLQHVLIFWGSVVFLTSYLLVVIAGDVVGLGQFVRNPGFFKSIIFAGDIAGGLGKHKGLIKLKLKIDVRYV